MFGAIVLRDIPKEAVRIDLARMPVEGGFRGFGQVPPGAWHYVSVKDGEHHRGFWCWIEPDAAAVRVFEDDGFQEDEPESAAQYAQLALSGAMGPALRPYPLESFGGWHGLVSHIPRDGFPPALRPNEQGESRFDLALQGSHGGAAEAFLAEFQFAFVAWLVSLDTPAEDERAFARWRHLLLGCYNAGERRIAANPGLFASLAELLPRQFALLPADWFGADSFLLGQIDYLIEDLADCGAPGLAERSAALAAYVKARRR